MKNSEKIKILICSIIDDMGLKKDMKLEVLLYLFELYKTEKLCEEND